MGSIMSKTPPLAIGMEVTDQKARMSLSLRRWLNEIAQLLDRSIPQAGDLRALPAGTDIPGGYRECNGQTLDKVGFRTLYSVIGGAYGETADTFNAPTITAAGVVWLIKT